MTRSGLTKASNLPPSLEPHACITIHSKSTHGSLPFAKLPSLRLLNITPSGTGSGEYSWECLKKKIHTCDPQRIHPLCPRRRDILLLQRAPLLVLQRLSYLVTAMILEVLLGCFDFKKTKKIIMQFQVSSSVDC
jgi:hypothetical protein